MRKRSAESRLPDAFVTRIHTIAYTTKELPFDSSLILLLSPDSLLSLDSAQGHAADDKS